MAAGLPTHRAPPTPGEILYEAFIAPMGWTQAYLAKTLRIHEAVMSRIINGKQAITPILALRLSKATNTTPRLWLDLQADLDIYRAIISSRE